MKLPKWATKKRMLGALLGVAIAVATAAGVPVPPGVVAAVQALVGVLSTADGGGDGVPAVDAKPDGGAVP